MLFNVPRAGVADSDRSIGTRFFLHEQGSQRLADDIAPPADNHMLAFWTVSTSHQHLLNPIRSTGQRTGLAPQELAHINWMKAVHILFRRYKIYHLVGIHPFRQGQLNQHAMKTLITVKAVNIF